MVDKNYLPTYYILNVTPPGGGPAMSYESLTPFGNLSVGDYYIQQLGTNLPNRDEIWQITHIFHNVAEFGDRLCHIIGITVELAEPRVQEAFKKSLEP